MALILIGEFVELILHFLHNEVLFFSVRPMFTNAVTLLLMIACLNGVVLEFLCTISLGKLNINNRLVLIRNQNLGSKNGGLSRDLMFQSNHISFVE